MLESHNNILTQNIPIVPTASLKNLISDSATIKEIIREEK
jgi:hypothetical protein